MEITELITGVAALSTEYHSPTMEITELTIGVAALGTDHTPLTTSTAREPTPQALYLQFGPPLPPTLLSRRRRARVRCTRIASQPPPPVLRPRTLEPRYCIATHGGSRGMLPVRKTIGERLAQWIQDGIPGGAEKGAAAERVMEVDTDPVGDEQGEDERGDAMVGVEMQEEGLVGAMASAA